MAVFSGLADVITGVVFIIGGIINGSWTDIWTGMKLVAFGVVDAIIGVVMELAGAIAGVVDALSSLFGSGTQWQQGIRDLRESVRSGMAEGMGVQGLSFTGPMPAPSALTPRVEPLPAGGGAAVPGSPEGALRAATAAPMPAVAALNGGAARAEYLGLGSAEQQAVVEVVTGPTGDGAVTYCSGTVIDPRWVLTAGHCVGAAPGDSQIIWFDDSGQVLGGSPVSELVVHEEVDVALLRLPTGRVRHQHPRPPLTPPHGQLPHHRAHPPLRGEPARRHAGR